MTKKDKKENDEKKKETGKERQKSMLNVSVESWRNKKIYISSSSSLL